jgi:hypothetical protein
MGVLMQKDDMYPMSPLMKCGHVANGRLDGFNEKPVCVSCYGIVEGADEKDPNPPALSGRIATCAYGGADTPSSLALPFFEYRGEGSYAAEKLCRNCGYTKTAHHNKAIIMVCSQFEPHGPWSTDTYYCGCRGWD